MLGKRRLQLSWNGLTVAARVTVLIELRWPLGQMVTTAQSTVFLLSLFSRAGVSLPLLLFNFEHLELLRLWAFTGV